MLLKIIWEIKIYSIQTDAGNLSSASNRSNFLFLFGLELFRTIYSTILSQLFFVEFS